MKSFSSLTRSGLALAAGIALAVQASAAAFSNLYVFGDSLSDGGNTSNLTGGLFPGGAYSDGRFSNGPVWVESLATEVLGLASLTPSSSGGTNFAYGGAYSANDGLPAPFTIGGAEFYMPSVQQQVDGYRSAGGTFSSGDLVVLWGGANDFLLGNQSDPSVAVANLSASVTSLAAAGATTILLPNLPDIGDTPRLLGSGDADLIAAASSLVQWFNSLLLAAVPEWESAHPGLDVIYLDFYSYSKEILAQPEAYGFSNVTDAYLASGEGLDPDAYAYFDDVHPTARVHELYAQQAALALGLIPEPSTLVLLLIPAVTLVSRRRRR